MAGNPLSIYQSRLASGKFKSDPAQRNAIIALDQLWQELDNKPGTGIWKKLTGAVAPPVKGIYLWGGVGRGKTWLMDLFFDSVPFQQKQRIHFHRFMARVHGALRADQSERDPLREIARKWSSRCRLLCFDEFFVSDIADAMLLAGLLEAMFDHGVVLAWRRTP